MSGVLIRQMFAAVDRRDFNRLRAIYTPDIVYERPGYAPMCGLAALEDFYRRVRTIASGTHELERVLIQENTAACWGRFSGRSQTGEPLAERFAEIYELRDGRISFRATYFYRAAI